MADSASGNIGQVLFEAGNTVKNQAQKSANAALGQLTGNQKPLFGQKPNVKPLGNQLPKMPNPLDFSELGKGGLGFKKPPLPQTPQFTQAQLDEMASQNKIKDDQEIAKRQAELESIKQQHQQLHNEVYYNKIRDVGQNTMVQARQAKEEEDKQKETDKEMEKQSQLQAPLAGTILNPNGKTGMTTLQNPQITSRQTGEAVKTSG